MKLSIPVVLLLCLASFDRGKELEIGAVLPMPEYKMIDVSEKEIILSSVKQKNGLLVIFSCNTCPWVLAWENRYNEIAELANKNDVGVVFVNSNEGKRDDDDSLEAMQKHAKKMNYNFLYTIDKNNTLADSFGATKTPHVYLFNKNNILVYRGAIDDNAKDRTKVKKPYLKTAILELAQEKEITNKTTKSIGCSIKRI